MSLILGGVLQFLSTMRHLTSTASYGNQFEVDSDWEG